MNQKLFIQLILVNLSKNNVFDSLHNLLTTVARQIHIRANMDFTCSCATVKRLCMLSVLVCLVYTKLSMCIYNNGCGVHTSIRYWKWAGASLHCDFEYLNKLSVTVTVTVTNNTCCYLTAFRSSENPLEILNMFVTEIVRHVLGLQQWLWQRQWQWLQHWVTVTV